MPKFENKHCYCVWEDCLIGKKVFFADSIGVLKKLVENNDQSCFDVVVEHYSEDFPFYVDGYGRFAFCYWDPIYEFKVAFEQGKTIQGYFRAMDEWYDLLDPEWVDDIQYRVKPEPETEPEKDSEFETTISLFEERFVHKVWSDELIGKKAFFADYEDDLKTFVEDDNRNFYGTVVRKFGGGRFTFHMENGEHYAYCYCDPYLEYKIAFQQGKEIEALMPDGIWQTVENPKFVYPPENYRIKSKEYEKPVTCRQLAEWLAKGNGEYKIEGMNRCYSEYWYNEDDLDELVSAKTWVRAWVDKNWHKPTLQYFGLN
jgi:hypothetical protein